MTSFWAYHHSFYSRFLFSSSSYRILTLLSFYSHPVLTVFSSYVYPIRTLFPPYYHFIPALFLPSSHRISILFPVYSDSMRILFQFISILLPSYSHPVLRPIPLGDGFCWLLAAARCCWLGAAGWGVGCVHCNPRSAPMSGQDACDACHVPRLWEGHKTVSTDFEVPIKTTPFWSFWFINTHSVLIVGSVWSLESWECWDSIHVCMW